MPPQVAAEVAASATSSRRHLKSPPLPAIAIFLSEACKSPVVDGVVMRNPDGKEVRYPVLLTPGEKQMARDVCLAFRQGGKY
ncbi:uncharacterized protein A4U43_C10F11780 [Asparagus officinalis]|uniref:Uncharacterized protein n=1 Tax=Asparagus officinalis TaxID=4686 RepID=A0A5P1E2G5_ASPOF|nr:uncharacterized protein A4U43_C10F11780 [Asparagus officinalis]